MYSYVYLMLFYSLFFFIFLLFYFIKHSGNMFAHEPATKFIF